MKYLCLIYSDETQWQKLPKAETDKMMGSSSTSPTASRPVATTWAATACSLTPAATTVRIRDGKLSTTDGPFAETREQLGGYYLVEAPDLNGAIRIASKIPAARYGSIEVRPVWEVVRP